MTFVVIDGDDIGRTIAAMYLRNDAISLGAFATTVEDKVKRIASLLKDNNFKVIFCAADGIAAHSDKSDAFSPSIYRSIQTIAGSDITFSAGVGTSLRAAYVALLAAKSNGKAQMIDYEEMH